MGVQISGLTNLTSRLADLTDSLQDEVDAEMSASATIIVHNAARRAPVDEGRLRGAIKEDISIRFKKTVTVNLDYAPFIEFGTRKKVSVPNGLEAYAAQFKRRLGRGGFDDMVKSLMGWLRRHGQGGRGLKSRAHMMALKILKTGIKPHPYLFPSFFEEQPKLIDRIEKIINP